MTIETKYNIGDEVWFKRFSEIYKLRIVGVSVLEKPPISFIEYYVVEEGDDISICLAEQILFPTKEELLKIL